MRRQISPLLLVVFLAGLGQATVAAASEPGETKIFLVRHAEKLDDDGSRPGPELSPEGHRRGAALAHALTDFDVDIVFVTPYQRTAATAAAFEGAAVFEEVPIEPGAPDYEAVHAADMAKRLRALGGGTALVVGHSNTLGPILAALGVEDPPAIGHDEYDHLFVVLLAEQGVGDEATPELRFLALRYGAPSHSDEPTEPRP